MKKILMLVFVFASGLQFSDLALAQSASRGRSNQTRRVKHQVLSSSQLPDIRVRFGKRYKYAGSQEFILYDRARVEQYFFLDADGERRIRRMYMVQFEGYLPSINATYDYPATKTVELGGQTYIVNAESIPDVPAALRQNPQSDVARAASFLESKGYRISESVRFQRFVRLVDEAKRHEFILLYVEDGNSGATSGGRQRERELSERALNGFTILR